ncbi:phosphomannomutase/phosphoglucomutase [Luteimonas sp. BDR2-5]|uniref:phosphomannomutase/phosphoglucomutase n=1 Tax=Proluteimonas luteida TaxID=2878685 RepID=UPI001E298B16|nr:phosphomannomutase/phosphoglucomutase [Luteimonas sp. BDR2-5]MCD9030066.1 phosphomannomutase/phosphoglucomutase [Luteimonas sp. BDR2-5]
MTETETHKSRVLLARLRPVTPVLAIVLVLLALWLAWSGWQQRQHAGQVRSAEQARDAAVAATGQALSAELARLRERLGSAPVQAALADGDLAAAAAALGADWPAAEAVEIVPADLRGDYATLEPGRFGRLAALEAALIEGRPVLMLVQHDGAPRVALAAPARVGGSEGGEDDSDGVLAGVALVRLPLARATAGLEAAPVDASTYVALRQASTTVLARGDEALANVAERMGTPVPGTGLRVVAAVPPELPAPFGLGVTPLFGAALLLLLLAGLVWRLPLRLQGAAPRDDTSPTLAESLQAPDPGSPDAAAAGAVPPPLPATTEESPRKKAPSLMLDRDIFRAYDIRGIVGKTLDAGVAELIGQSVGSLMREQDLTDIVVGRDGRLSGPELVAGLIAGLRKAGRNVIDIGMAPTPLVYFGAYHLRTGCCISVTGSHNPPDYNGFKIVVGGETLSGDTIADLHARVADDRLYSAPQPGGLSERDISADYVERIAGDIQIARPLKVVVDAGNGVAGELGPRVLEAIGAEVIPLYCDIDGTFPNHHPDPSEPHNLEDLISTVQRFDADLGIAFDGDGDRLGVVTRDGHNIYPDRLLMLFAADVLERNPGALILFDVKCTGRLPGHVLRHGGSPLMWKTGHSLIKSKMRETGAELAGEMSGHFFFSERWYGFDDGIYAAARLLEILAVDADPSAVLDALPNGISTPEIKVDAPNGDPHSFVARVQASASFEGARLSDIDGVRADWADGWGLVRASNTTPVLVLRFDADSKEALARIQAAFREQLLALDPELQLPF